MPKLNIEGIAVKRRTVGDVVRVKLLGVKTETTERDGKTYQFDNLYVLMDNDRESKLFLNRSAKAELQYQNDLAGGLDAGGTLILLVSDMSAQGEVWSVVGYEPKETKQ